MQIIEELLLDEYYLLTKRIEGMSLSLEDFFNADSFHISYLLQKEKELIDYEQEEYERMEKEMKNTNSTGSQAPLKQKDSPNAVMMYEAYFDDG